MNRDVGHIWWPVMSLLGLVTLSLPTHAASFDCEKAQLEVERLICGVPEISKLDYVLSKRYKSALQDHAHAEAIKREQRQWLQERNDCQDVDCLRAAYQGRINRLSRISTLTAAPKHFELIKGKGIKVCEIYKNNLDALRNKDIRCEREVSSEYSKVIKKPEWTVLDIWESRNLAALAGKFLDFGETDRKDTIYDSQKNIDDTASQQLVLKGMTIAITQIDIDNDGVNERILQYQSGICGLARFSYTTAIMVLDGTSDTVDARRSQLIYPDSWSSRKTGEQQPFRDYHYVTYGIFSVAGETYFDRIHRDGLLSVYKAVKRSNVELCKFKYTTK